MSHWLYTLSTWSLHQCQLSLRIIPLQVTALICTPQSSCMVIAINSIQSGLPTHTVLGLITSFNHPLFNTLTKTHPTLPSPSRTHRMMFQCHTFVRFWSHLSPEVMMGGWSKQMCGWTIVHNKEMVKLEVPTLWLLDFPINNETRHHLPPHPVAVVPAPRPVEALLQSEDPRIQNLMRSTNVQVRLREGCCVDWLLEGWWSLLISMMSWEGYVQITCKTIQPLPQWQCPSNRYPRCWCCDAPRDSPTNVAPKDSRALRRASSSWRFKVAGIRRIWLVLVVCDTGPERLSILKHRKVFSNTVYTSTTREELARSFATSDDFFSSLHFDPVKKILMWVWCVLVQTKIQTSIAEESSQPPTTCEKLSMVFIPVATLVSHVSLSLSLCSWC